MTHSILRIIEVIAIIGCITSSIYYFSCIWSASVFLRSGNENGGAGLAENLPAVSILKPLKGPDPEIYESFRSHCVQDYAEYELIFGVSDLEDPAVAIVERLKQEFPERAIQITTCPERLGPNVKVSNLEQMARIARHGYFIINDSDIRVESDYIRRVMAPLTDERVGLVTCLYRGVAAATLGSRLESLGISTDFCAGVLVARALQGGVNFGLGSTLALRRTDLEKMGGFRAIVDFLADDYELGHRISELGMRVVLSDVVVETHLPAYDVPAFLKHQLRWARGVRDSRFGGYIGLSSTFGLLWALLALITSQAPAWAWIILGIVFALRLSAAVVVGRNVLRDRQLWKNLWLIPIRDLIAVVVWVASFAGHTVTWRGDTFFLKKGRLYPSA